MQPLILRKWSARLSSTLLRRSDRQNWTSRSRKLSRSLLLSLVLLSSCSGGTAATFEVIWGRVTTDVEGNYINPDNVVYLVQMVVGNVWETLAETRELSFQTDDLADGCYSFRIVARREDTGEESQPSEVVEGCISENYDYPPAAPKEVRIEYVA